MMFMGGWWIDGPSNSNAPIRYVPSIPGAASSESSLPIVPASHLCHRDSAITSGHT